MSALNKQQGKMPPLPAATEAALASDDDLLLLTADGDHHAFATLYDRTVPRVLGLVTQCLRDNAQSEEVTQEIYLELWQNAARFDSSKGKATSWLLTTARRRAIDRVRSSQASRDRDMRIGIRNHPIDYDHVAEAIDTQGTRVDVTQALMRLTPLQREVIQMVYFESLSTAEIAKELHAPVSTIKTRLRDGLLSLRRIMTQTAA